MGNVSTAIGVGFGLSAEFFVSYGNIQVKLSHRNETKREVERPVYKRPRWYWGVFMWVLNSIFNLASYAFASLTVLAPTASLTIVINAFLAYIYFKEKLTKLGWSGSVLVVLGCIICILTGSDNGDGVELNELADDASALSFILTATIHVALTLTCLYIGKTWKPHHHPSTITTDADSSAAVLHISPPDTDTQKVIQLEKITKKMEENSQKDSPDSHSFEEIDITSADFQRKTVGGGQEEKEEESDPADISTSDMQFHMANHLSSTNTMGNNSSIVIPAKKRKGSMEDHKAPLTENMHGDSGSHQIKVKLPRITSNPPDMDNLEYQEYLRREGRRHAFRCVCFGFATAGLVAWVQIMWKALMDLFRSSMAGQNQFDEFTPWIILVFAFGLLFAEIHMVTEMMRIFDAVMIVPIYNSLCIVTQIGLTEAYYHSFDNFAAWRILLFFGGVGVTCGGIAAVTIGQEAESMKNHEIDQINRIQNAQKHAVMEVAASLQDVNASVDELPLASLDEITTVAAANVPSKQWDTLSLASVADTNPERSAETSDRIMVNRSGAGHGIAIELAPRDRDPDILGVDKSEAMNKIDDDSGSEVDGIEYQTSQ